MLNLAPWPVPWAVLVVPAVALGAAAWLRHLPGEWSQAALLGWTALLLAHASSLAWPPDLGPWLPALGLVLAFLAVATGGWVGLALLAVAFLLLAVAALAGVAQLPWWAAGLIALASGAAAIRTLL